MSSSTIRTALKLSSPLRPRRISAPTKFPTRFTLFYDQQEADYILCRSAQHGVRKASNANRGVFLGLPTSCGACRSANGGYADVVAAGQLGERSGMRAASAGLFLLLRCEGRGSA